MSDVNASAIMGCLVFNDMCKKIDVDPATIYKIKITCNPTTVEIETDGIVQRHFEWLDCGFGTRLCNAIGITPGQVNQLVVTIEEDDAIRMLARGFVPKKAFDIEFPELSQAIVTDGKQTI